jgi:hypothetical protein
LSIRRLSASELDNIGLRLAAIDAEEERLHAQLEEQIQEFGSTPPRAEKSKRIETTQYKFTLSTSTTTEIFDAEVERIRDACPSSLFEQLFVTVKKYKLAKAATMLLAGTLPENAPRNLRQMFSKAVMVSEGSPRLRVEKLEEVTA